MEFPRGNSSVFANFGLRRNSSAEPFRNETIAQTVVSNMKKPYLLILLIIIFPSCKSKWECFEKTKYEIKTDKELVQIARKTTKERNQTIIKDEKEGIENDFLSPMLYFEKNCNSQQDLKAIEPIVGALLINENLKIQLVGNAEKSELNINEKISLERANFVAEIFKLNGINKKRIIVIDAKAKRNYGVERDSENQINRRVDLEIIN